MTEREKAQKGYLYDANYDPEIIEEETRCADLCYEFNQCRPSDTKKQKELLTKILGSMKENPVIDAFRMQLSLKDKIKMVMPVGILRKSTTLYRKIRKK